ncbi:hypothetical protein [Lentzea sp. NPDC059081]|uniref:hypothetical protein n=1 Tax=Lentzea sp. NPDC059081 TaxID=3346719 RepID=UPI00369B809E
MRLLLGSLLAVLALVGGTAAAQADVPLPPYPQVTTWADVNVRTCESTACPVAWVMKAGTIANGICWTRGENVQAYGIWNDVWIKVSSMDGGRYLASAIFFVGDNRANLPYENDCGGL